MALDLLCNFKKSVILVEIILAAKSHHNGISDLFWRAFWFRSLSVTTLSIVYSTGGLGKAVHPFLLVEHCWSRPHHELACLPETSETHRFGDKVAQSCDAMARWP